VSEAPLDRPGRGDLDALIRRSAAEEVRRNEERQAARAAGEKFGAAASLLSRIKSGWPADLRGRLEREPTPAEERTYYADLLISYVRAVRDAGLSLELPALTPASDGARLALEVLRLALAEDAGEVVCILAYVEEKAPEVLGTPLIMNLLDLLHRLLGTPADQPGDWAETGAGAEQQEKPGEGAGRPAAEGGTMTERLPAELADVLYALELVFRDEPIPERPDRQPLIRQDTLVERLAELGIPQLRARALIDALVARGVFRVEDSLVNLTTFTRLDGTGQTTDVKPIRRLGIDLTAWAHFLTTEKSRANSRDVGPADTGHASSAGPPNEEPEPEAAEAEGQGGRRTGPIPSDEANEIVRAYIKEKESRGENITAREVSSNCKIALGRVPKMPAWRAYQARKSKSQKPGKSKEHRQLTDDMLAAIGKEDDPSAGRADAEEAAWHYLLDSAKTPAERARLHSMKPAEKAQAIDLVIEQRADKDRRGPRQAP
jgi:hypothetical protein